MGIFKKNKDEELEHGNFSSNVSQSTFSSNQAKQMKRTSQQNYGIEDAIALMRKLPNVNSDITITVVKKTLESAHIQVAEIISDAESKESQIRERTQHLTQEIDQLENRISTLNNEITSLTSDLKETTKVKDLLMSASKAEASKPELVKAGSEELDAATV